MRHSTFPQRNNCGENLAKFKIPDLLKVTNIATQKWFDELADYNFDRPGLSTKTA